MAQFFQSSYDEIRDLMARKESVNTQKAAKSVVATLFVFCMEVSAEESPAKNLEKLSRSESLHSKTLNVLTLGEQ